jgi:hypothetical protein
MLWSNEALSTKVTTLPTDGSLDELAAQTNSLAIAASYQSFHHLSGGEYSQYSEVALFGTN